MRTAPEGSALWTPAGAYAPDPEMLRISASPAGGTGDFGALFVVCTSITGLPKGGQAGWFHAELYSCIFDLWIRYRVCWKVFSNLIKKYLSFIITIQTAIYKSIKNSILVVSVSRERSCSAAFFAVFQA